MIDLELHNKLRAEYNPDGSLLRRQQMRMLEILLHIDKICKEHNIPYWLSSGTLLGAVRHGGFIPWDDDLDIEMMREDYLRFEKVFKETDDYVLQTHKNDPCYVMPYAKVRDKHSILIEHYDGEQYKYKGVFVDVFPMENTNKQISFISYCPVWLMQKFSGKVSNSKLKTTIFRLAKMLLFFYIAVLRVLIKLIPGKKLCYSLGTWCYKEDRERTEIFPLTTIQFEGINFPSPSNANGYLRRIYGNFMQIPKTKETHVKTIEFLK